MPWTLLFLLAGSVVGFRLEEWVVSFDEDTPTIPEYLAQIFHGTNKDNISLNQSSLEKDQRIIYEII